jgi:hypothetical protein
VIRGTGKPPAAVYDVHIQSAVVLHVYYAFVQMCKALNLLYSTSLGPCAVMMISMCAVPTTTPSASNACLCPVLTSKMQQCQ